MDHKTFIARYVSANDNEMDGSLKAGKGYEDIIFAPDSAEAHKSLRLRNARAYCQGVWAA